MTQQGIRRDDLNSMLYWWPRILKANLDIPMPETSIYVIPEEELKKINIDTGYVGNLPYIKDAARAVGYPLFMRTDQASGKHEWNYTCYVPSEEDLLSHIIRLYEFNYCADIIGLQFKALIFRKLIPMATLFHAFEGMPVNPERRYFTFDGKVLCHHPYWVKAAIVEPDNGNWVNLLRRMNREVRSEVDKLSKYAAIIGSLLKGYWSIDFCKSASGEWYFIDAALGQDSWHPHCKLIPPEYRREEPRRTRRKTIDLTKLLEVEEVKNKQ